MKDKSKTPKRKSVAVGAISSFSINGEGLGLRDVDNIEASWYNVGIYFKRAINKMSITNNHRDRYSREELETY